MEVLFLPYLLEAFDHRIIFLTKTFLTPVMKTAAVAFPQPFIPAPSFPFHSTDHFPSHHRLIFIMFTIYYLPPSAKSVREIIFTCLGCWCIQRTQNGGWEHNDIQNIFLNEQM